MKTNFIMFEEVSTGYLSNNLGYVDSHEIVCVMLENYLAQLLYRHDLNRICYSSPSIAFRKRMELTKAKSTDAITIQNLDLPFCNLFVDPQVSLDDRKASVNTRQTILGYKGGSDIKIRSTAVKYTASANLFFNSFSDVKIAQTVLLQECTPSTPVIITTEIFYEDLRVELPVGITYKEIKAEPFDESNFLKQSKIYTLSVSFDIRTYNLFIPQLNDQLLQFKHIDRNTGLPIKPFYTVEAKANWAVDKLQDHDTDFDVTEAYLEPAPINCDFYEEEIGEDFIKLKVKSEDFERISNIKIFIKRKWSNINLSETFIDEETEESFKSFEIKGLTPNSTYEVIFCAETDDIQSKLFKMTLRTKEVSDEQAPIIEENASYTDFNKQEPKKYEEPKDDYSDFEGLDLEG